jgi:hypothetical protein
MLKNYASNVFNLENSIKMPNNNYLFLKVLKIVHMQNTPPSIFGIKIVMIVEPT